MQHHVFNRKSRTPGCLTPGVRLRASALLVVLLLGIMTLLIISSMVLLANFQTRDRHRYEINKDEFAAAEVAINKAFGQIDFMVSNHTPDFENTAAAMTAPNVANITYDSFAVTRIDSDGDSATLVPAGEKWAGYWLYRPKYRVQVTARKTSGLVHHLSSHNGVSISQDLTIYNIPLYLFAIFYDPVMEIAPGASMTVNGLVHCNGDAYFQSSSGLDFYDNVTVAGDVYHGRHPDSGKSDANGSVRFTDASDSSLASMYQDGSWVESSDSDWLTEAMNLWSGGLKDGALGAATLDLPVECADPHDIIERADSSDTTDLLEEKFEYQAGLVIECDGVTAPTTDIDGVNLVDSGETPYLSMGELYDAREGETITTLNIDIAKLIESGNYPDNGILYVSTEDLSGTYEKEVPTTSTATYKVSTAYSVGSSYGGGTVIACKAHWTGHGRNRRIDYYEITVETTTTTIEEVELDAAGAVRLINAEELPSTTVGGFTIATDDALYIQGDYNTVNKTKALVAADALMILSNAWSDTNGTHSAASDTTVNAVCMHGNVTTISSVYSGGVENNFRFLENWSGKTFTFCGSIIIMWASESFTAPWSYGSPVYSAPNRNWGWDTDLGGMNGPPGAPTVIEIVRDEWKIANASDFSS